MGKNDDRIGRLSASGKAELKHALNCIRENPDDEAEPTARFDSLPQSEKDIIIDIYFEKGGK